MLGINLLGEAFKIVVGGGGGGGGEYTQRPGTGWRAILKLSGNCIPCPINAHLIMDGSFRKLPFVGER